MRLAAGMLFFLLFFSSQVAQSEECPAAKAWFAAGGTPAPSNSEPKRGNDCEFYQRAWQTFLYVTNLVDRSPRLLSYKTYGEVFGIDPKAGPLGVAESGARMIVLAPRMMKTAQAADAEDIFQAGSNAILLDSSGRPIFYNIFLNPIFADFVRRNGYNQLPKLIAAPAD